MEDFVVEITRMKTTEERALLQVTASNRGEAWRDAQLHVNEETNADQLAWFLGNENNSSATVINVLEKDKRPQITIKDDDMERGISFQNERDNGET